MLSKNSIVGYSAGIITGITYGLNPLFGIPLMNDGASIDSILFFRYGFSVVLLAAFLILSRQSFKVTPKQLGILLILGLLYTSSSICLFESYKYIASGLATTLIFLYPVFVALIMVVLRVYPTWQVWLAILATFVGVLILAQSDDTQTIDPIGVLLALGSGLSYAIFIVIVNSSRIIRPISSTMLTFYSLSVGMVIFYINTLLSPNDLTTGINGSSAWLCLIGLAILPTIISTATLALSTRKIGATKASVLGVFEPITAIMVGTIAFNEPITTNIIVGISIAIAAIIFMIMATKK
ncbi:MAG: EamA family transporter [Muribaculaceae bacterium]|nr:EamA family transporter [Muribaculaceae bacterium]MBO7165643.1 EamA family transporter [Muribaculaceae bacterium]